MTLIDPSYLSSRLRYRDPESHKRNYGHLLIIAGCESMPGAAVLATGAALQSGCGLVTLHATPRALQATVNNFPSAMLSEEPAEHFYISLKDACSWGFAPQRSCPCKLQNPICFRHEG